MVPIALLSIDLLPVRLLKEFSLNRLVLLVICHYHRLFVVWLTLELELVATTFFPTPLAVFRQAGKIHLTYSTHPRGECLTPLLLIICSIVDKSKHQRTQTVRAGSKER